MLRVLIGIVVGLAYGVLVGSVIFLLDLITRDSDHTGGLILDPKAILRFLILLAMIITGSAGALVGLMVTLFRAGKIKAAMIGFCTGLVVLGGVVLKISSQLKLSAQASWSEVGFLILMFSVLIIMFPAGLAATGMIASVAAGKFVLTR